MEHMGGHSSSQQTIVTSQLSVISAPPKISIDTQNSIFERRYNVLGSYVQFMGYIIFIEVVELCGEILENIFGVGEIPLHKPYPHSFYSKVSNRKIIHTLGTNKMFGETISSEVAVSMIAVWQWIDQAQLKHCIIKLEMQY